MISVTRNGYSKNIIEVKDIVAAARKASFKRRQTTDLINPQIPAERSLTEILFAEAKKRGLIHLPDLMRLKNQFI